MSSSFQFSITSGFRVIDRLQQTIVANTAGLLKPGYNRQKVHVGHTSANESDGAQDATRGAGGRASIGGGGDQLAIGGTSLNFEQGQIDPDFSPTSLAIRGSGFFILAENDLPGTRTFMTRAGDFSFDAQGRLVNPQGMFVVGGSGQVALDDKGRMVGAPPLVRALGDGTVDLTQLSLGKVGASSQLGISGYGDTVYSVTGTSGPMRVFPNGRPEVGFVQASSIEVPDRVGAFAILQAETATAIQSYKIFKDMLTEFNKTTDDAIQTVK